MKQGRGEALFALVLLAVFLVIVLVGTGYNRKARMLPLVLGVPGVALAAAEVVRTTARRRRAECEAGVASGKAVEAHATEGAGPAGGREAEERKKLLEMFGWVVLLIVMIWLFGFLVTIPIYVLAFMKARKERWLLSLCFAIGSWALLYWVFVLGLKIVLYPGLLFKNLPAGFFI